MQNTITNFAIHFFLDQFSFKAWSLHHKKVYFSEDELKVRKTNFLLSREQVGNHNSEASSWKSKPLKFFYYYSVYFIIFVKECGLVMYNSRFQYLLFMNL